MAAETLEETLRRVLDKQKKHGHRFWGLQSLQVFQQRADAVLNQASPVSATLYTVLDTTKNVRIISIAVSVTWTVQPTPLEVVITIDGQTIIHRQANPVTTTAYGLTHDQNVDGQTPALQILTDIWTARYISLQYEGRSVKVEARTTGGTVSNLTCRVKWAQNLP